MEGNLNKGEDQEDNAGSPHVVLHCLGHGRDTSFKVAGALETACRTGSRALVHEPAAAEQILDQHLFLVMP